MSLKFGRLAIPKRTETVNNMNCDVSIQSLNGGFPGWAGGGGEIRADFTDGSSTQPHSAIGHIKLYNGGGTTFLDVENALIQVEQGPNDGVWKTWSNFAAEGVDAQGIPYAFRLGEQNALDPTSLIVDFAIAATGGFTAAQEVKTWQGVIQPVAGGDFDPLLAAWIEAQGVNVSSLEAFIRSLGNKVHGQNAAEKVVEWIEANVVTEINPTTILAIALAGVAEIRGGKPGYNPSHGGLV